MEEQDADPERRSTFLSVCDKFQDIVERCTIGPKGKFYMQQNEISLLANIASYENHTFKQIWFLYSRAYNAYNRTTSYR